jgi:hypothetical protein
VQRGNKEDKTSFQGPARKTSQQGNNAGRHSAPELPVFTSTCRLPIRIPELLSRACADTLPGRIESGKIPLGTRELLALDTTLLTKKLFLAQQLALSQAKITHPYFVNQQVIFTVCFDCMVRNYL